MNQIVDCALCPRLRAHCNAVAAKKKQIAPRFAKEQYWGKPVPNFGTLPASLLIVGLAPAAHGGNRTGRMFTGDDSGKWLYRALHKSGFATTDGFERVGDNTLIDCAITAAAHCAPPDNKPNSEELANCAPFLKMTIKESQAKAILCLGAIAWKATLKILGARGEFKHGAHISIESGHQTTQHVIASYHPSRQNTNTKRLTEPMFDEIFKLVRQLV